jgi:hypothetical protein
VVVVDDDTGLIEDCRDFLAAAEKEGGATAAAGKH